MDEKILLDRIIKDAKAEAKKIINEAKELANSNLAYAKAHAEEKISEASVKASTLQKREIDIAQENNIINKRLEILKQKSKIVDEIFAQVKKEIKFPWKITRRENYEVHMTADEMFKNLRDEIEAEVVNILFNGENLNE